MPKTAPVITSAFFDGTNIHLTWEPNDSAYMYINLYDVNDPNPANPQDTYVTLYVSSDNGWTTTPHHPLVENKFYQVKCVKANNSGYTHVSDYCAPLEVIQNPLKEVSAKATTDTIEVKWELPDYISVEGVIISLFQEGNPTHLVQEYVEGALEVTLNAQLSKAESYYLILQPSTNNQISTGPTTRIDLEIEQNEALTTIPIIKSVVNLGNNGDSGKIRVRPEETFDIQLKASLYKNGEHVIDATTTRTDYVDIPSFDVDASALYEVKLQYFDGEDASGQSEAAPIVTGFLELEAAIINGDALTVTWQNPINPPEPTGGRILLYEDASKLFTKTFNGQTGTVDLPTPPEDTNYQIKLRAFSSISNTSNGPQPRLTELISAKPTIQSAQYIAGGIQAEWAQLDQDVVTGYEISLYDSAELNTPIATTQSAENSYNWQYPLAADKTYVVTVRGIGDKITGPESQSVQIVMNPIFTPSPNPNPSTFCLPEYNPNTVPLLYNTDNISADGQSFELFLPELFKTPPTDLAESLTNPPYDSPFVLTKTEDDLFPYKLSVPSNSNTWQITNADTPIRTTLAASYHSFLSSLESVEGGLVPGAIPFLQQIIARSFPLTYEETLYYAYGLDAANRYCDLKGGMRVRVDFEQYQFVVNNADSLQNGMVGSGSTYYHLGAYLDHNSPDVQSLNVGFTNFLANFSINVPEPRGGGAGLLDTYFNGFRQPYLRLFYPKNFAIADNPGWGRYTKNIAIVAAENFSDMEAATQRFIDGKPFPDNVKVTFLRGRAVIIPEILTHIKGQSQYVPIGTTIRQLMAPFTNLPLRALPGIPDNRSLNNLTYQRSVANVVRNLGDETNEVLFDATNVIDLGYQNMISYSDGRDCLDLPVLQSDSINF